MTQDKRESLLIAAFGVLFGGLLNLGVWALMGLPPWLGFLLGAALMVVFNAFYLPLKWRGRS